MAVKRLGAVAFGVVALVLVTASVGWACLAGTAPPFVGEPQPGRALAGSSVTVGGGSWATSGPVEVLWDSATGPVLGLADVDSSGTFSVTVVIPRTASPGSYLLVARQGSTAKPTVIEVPAPLTAASDPQPTGPGAPPTTGPAIVANRTSGGSLQAPASATTEVPSSPSRAAAAAPGPANPAPPAPSGSPGRAAGQVAASAPGDPAAIPLPAATDERPAPGTSRLSSGNLWSGFAPETGGSFRAPGLADVESASPGRVNAAPVGLALLAGLAAMAGGFSVVELRRRRATVMNLDD